MIFKQCMKVLYRNWILGEKTCQNAENKHTFDLREKIEIDEKTRQNAENKQTFDLTGKIDFGG